MRPLASLVTTLLLAGCAVAKPDAIVSALARQDCSILHLDRGLPYCLAPEPATVPQPFCTRSRGSVDCWRSPPLALPPHRGVADTPAGPPPERQARPWPRLIGEASP